LVLAFAALLAGAISTVLLLSYRHRQDLAYRDAVVCLDYNAIFQLSEVSGKDLDSILAELAGIGYSSIAVAEMTVLSAGDKGYLFEATDDMLISWAAQNPKLKDILGHLLPRRNFCMLGRERSDAAKARLELQYGENLFVAEVSPGRLQAPEGLSADFGDSADEWFLFSIPREAEFDFNKVNLGFDPSEWRRVRAAGFDVVPRLVNNYKYDSADLAAVFEDLEKVSDLTAVPGAPVDIRCLLFEGDAVLGFPDNLKATASEISKRNWIWAWIEFEIQEGAGALASLLSPNIVVTHSISAEEMIKQTAPIAKSRFIRALKERDVRLIYVRPHFVGLFSSGNGGAATAVDAVEFNRAYLSELMEAVKQQGFTVAREPAVPPRSDPTPLKLFVVAGVIALAGLTLKLFIRPPDWIVIAYWIFAIVGSIGLLVLSPTKLFAGWALVAALVAPVVALAISTAVLFRGELNVPVPYLRTVIAYFAATVSASFGGAMVYALLSSPAAMVKVETFHGVYVSLALPVLLAAIHFWDIRTFVRDGDGKLPSFISRLNALLDRKIEFVDMLVVFLGLAALALILLRSGNEAPIGVATFEQLFRNRLEDLLAVRPRTKEIVGYPALFFFIAYFFRRKPPSIVLLLLGAVALTSAVNTFCHLHTPIAISVVRSLLGIALGLLTGSAAYFAWWTYLKILSRLKPKS